MLKSPQPVVLLAPSQEAEAFFRFLGPGAQMAGTPKEAIELIAKCLWEKGEAGPACVEGR